jgi:tripartite-type tricarboxylate transporter receptor subunit TctC
MHRARLLAGLVSALILSGVLATPAAAQSYPSRVVKLIVPQTPGGATDVFARKIGQLLSEKWGQPVVIENRAGAGGVVGTDVVAKSAPDGYTLLVTYAGSQAINPALYPKIPFDSVKDFQTVATLASTPFVLIVHPKLPAKDLAEYVALARAKPDALTYASSGNGSVNHLLGEMLKTEADIKMLHVPYRGVAPAITDVIGGQVDSAFSSVPSVLQMVQTDKVRALAISSAKRIAAAPEIPTIAELGFPGFDVNPWWGILAPAGIDATIVRKINEDVANILRTKEMIDFLAAQGAEPLMTSPEAFLKILEADVVKWAKVVKSAGVTLN